jgi:hypothetical protein
MIKTWNLVKIINKISGCTREKKGVLLLEGRWENVLGLINLREYEGMCFVILHNKGWLHLFLNHHPSKDPDSRGHVPLESYSFFIFTMELRIKPRTSSILPKPLITRPNLLALLY